MSLRFTKVLDLLWDNDLLVRDRQALNLSESAWTALKGIKNSFLFFMFVIFLVFGTAIVLASIDPRCTPASLLSLWVVMLTVAGFAIWFNVRSARFVLSINQSDVQFQAKLGAIKKAMAEAPRFYADHDQISGAEVEWQEIAEWDIKVQKDVVKALFQSWLLPKLFDYQCKDVLADLDFRGCYLGCYQLEANKTMQVFYASELFCYSLLQLFFHNLLGSAYDSTHAYQALLELEESSLHIWRHRSVQWQKMESRLSQCRIYGTTVEDLFLVIAIEDRQISSVFPFSVLEGILSAWKDGCNVNSYFKRFFHP